MDNVKLNAIKKHLIDVNEGSNDDLKNNNWNEGYVMGLRFSKYIDDEMEEYLMEWIKSNPIINTIDEFVDEIIDNIKKYI